ncbi:hypothetical protein Tco_0596905 [Tanacetum coccineum]
MIDYALWEVIENGATLPKTQVMEGVTTVMPITFAEDKAQRRLEVKARSTLMMGIAMSSVKFNSIMDAKAIAESYYGKEGSLLLMHEILVLIVQCGVLQLPQVGDIWLEDGPNYARMPYSSSKNLLHTSWCHVMALVDMARVSGGKGLNYGTHGLLTSSVTQGHTKDDQKYAALAESAAYFSPELKKSCNTQNAAVLP